MVSLAILAAGWGSRYGGLKQIDGFGPNNESLLDYSVYDAIRAGIKDVVFVIREEIVPIIEEKIQKAPFNSINCNYCLQQAADMPINIGISRNKPWGTAHALYSARNVIKTPFILINADDFYGLSSFLTLSAYLKHMHKNSTEFAFVGFRLDRSLSANGSVSRGVCTIKGSRLLSINEKHGLIKNDKGQIVDNADIIYSGKEIVSMNCWGFSPKIFNFLDIEIVKFLNSASNLETDEFMIPSVIMNLIKNNTCRCEVFASEDRPFGITYLADKSLVRDSLKNLHSLSIYPNNLTIDSND